MTAFTQPDAGHVKPPLPAPAGALATRIIATVKSAAASAPRSRQREVGPSELGTPCTRRLAYRALGQDPVNLDTDPWASIQGTAVHAWLAETFGAQSRILPDTPGHHYLVEHRIHLPEGITGSCDLYDRDTGDVIDWKLTSPQNLAKYRRNGPGGQYRTQAHLYALGLQLQGEQPRRVNIVFLPRGGRIDQLHAWSEDYDPAVAAAAIRRYQAVMTALWSLDPEADPARWALFPTADAYCLYCPFHLPGSPGLGKGCPGHDAKG